MENRISNPLEHIAIIDFCYWRLGELNRKLSKPTHPIEDMIDTACGYDKTEEIRKETISLLEQIIESKKAIGSDYSGDSKFSEQIKNLD